MNGTRPRYLCVPRPLVDLDNFVHCCQLFRHQDNLLANCALCDPSVGWQSIEMVNFIHIKRSDCRRSSQRIVVID